MLHMPSGELVEFYDAPQCLIHECVGACTSHYKSMTVVIAGRSSRIVDPQNPITFVSTHHTLQANLISLYIMQSL